MPPDSARAGGRRTTGFLVATAPTVAIPLPFFTDVLPQIRNLEELHVTLTLFRHVAEGGGMETPIAERALLRDRLLREALRREGSPRDPRERLASGLDLAVARGTALRFTASVGRRQQSWYYVNTAANRGTVTAMAEGRAQPPPVLWDDEQAPRIQVDRPNLFRLYEQNIGPLTPLLADRMIHAMEEYPTDWIEEAIEESVAYNRRSWRYIQRILEQWMAQGRTEREK